MRIAWFTPFYAGNAIGKYGSRIVDVLLNRGHQVVVFGCGEGPLQDSRAPVVSLGISSYVQPSSMRQFDMIVYNVGNHPSSFPIIAQSAAVPGIIILHDRVYAHVLAAYGMQFLKDATFFERAAAETYGSEGTTFARKFLLGRATADEIDRFPLWEPIVHSARAVIALSEYQYRLVAERWAGPLLKLNLPPLPTHVVEPTSLDSLGLRDGALLLLYLGNFGPYRRVHVLFEVLRDRPDLADRLDFVAVGRTEDKRYVEFLRYAVDLYELQESVRIVHDADERVVQALLMRADIAYNCRYPSTEGQAASLLEQMSHGIPTIVTKTGSACDIPDDAAYFVDPKRLRAGVEKALEDLIGSEELRRSLRERAAAYSSAAHSNEDEFADALLSLVKDAQAEGEGVG